MKKIGIITSGGDCGGLNAVVKGVAEMAMRKRLGWMHSVLIWLDLRQATRA